MRTRRALRALLATAAMAGAGLIGGRPAEAQNTYLDAPFQQGSMRYRPSGAKPPQTTTNTPRGLFRRNPGYTPSYPQTYRPQTPYVAAPGTYRPYYYYPTPTYPTARYYYPYRPN